MGFTFCFLVWEKKGALELVLRTYGRALTVAQFNRIVVRRAYSTTQCDGSVHVAIMRNRVGDVVRGEPGRDGIMVRVRVMVWVRVRVRVSVRVMQDGSR